MKSAAHCKRLIAQAGLHVGVERDATIGFEFTVEDSTGRCVAFGWSAGNKTAALNDAVTHPAVEIAIKRAAEQGAA